MTLRKEHAVQIPADAKPGQRIWQQLEGQWFDFTVAPPDNNSIPLIFAP